MPKYYRYTDRNGLVSKERTHCPSGYFEYSQDAIRHMLNNYNETLITTKKKVKRAANVLNQLKHRVVLGAGNVDISKEPTSFLEFATTKEQAIVKNDYPLICVMIGDE